VQAVRCSLALKRGPVADKHPKSELLSGKSTRY
jgi:hypothetical protein